MEEGIFSRTLAIDCGHVTDYVQEECAVNEEVCVILLKWHIRL